MPQATNENTERFRDQVVVLDEHDQWREIEGGRERLVVTPAGVFVVQRDDLWAQLRPATRADFRRFAGYHVPVSRRWGELVPQTPLPFAILLQAVSFFRTVWKRYQREDILLIYFHYKEKPPRFELVHPRLVSAGMGHVDCKIPETPRKAIRFGTLHSHGAMSAFHSPEDRRDDEQSPGIHIIIGNLDQPLPTLMCVFSDGEWCDPVEPSAVFDFPSAGFPNDWLVANVPKYECGDARRPESY